MNQQFSLISLQTLTVDWTHVWKKSLREWSKQLVSFHINNAICCKQNTLFMWEKIKIIISRWRRIQIVLIVLVSLQLELTLRTGVSVDVCGIFFSIPSPFTGAVPVVEVLVSDNGCTCGMELRSEGFIVVIVSGKWSIRTMPFSRFTSSSSMKPNQYITSPGPNL